MSLLQVKDLRIAFGQHAVVHGVSFSIEAGEKLALVGESGSGKTVTAQSLMGLVQGANCSGEALWSASGQPVNLLGLSSAALRRICGSEIAMIFQEPMTALNPVFTIGEQIAEVLRLKLGMSARQAAAQVLALLELTGIDEPSQRARAYAHQLSGGQRQRAMIAMALAARPKLLLADEPTTALDPTIRVQILELLGQLQREMGMAVLLITHDLPLVRSFADRVAVMAHGHIVEQGTVDGVFTNPQHAATRALRDSQPVRDVVAPDPAAANFVEATQLQVRYPRSISSSASSSASGSGSGSVKNWRSWFHPEWFVALQGADFSLSCGQTLGVVGESGSGKTTLALAVLGLLPSAGGVAIDGRQWGQGRASDLQNRKELQVVFQDPFSSLSPRLTLEEIVGEGLLVHAPELSAAERRERVNQALHEVGLDDAQFPGLLSRYAHQFSGGQRQRIAIARALVVQPRALVLDEPTSALDASMARQILQLLQRLQREKGLAYLLITHDIAVIRAMAHQVLVLKGGQIQEYGPLEQVFTAPASTYTRNLLSSALISPEIFLENQGT